ncbi:hypothetical protein LNP74_20630 [Klebsiella pneumoniae subsp. pneumoniae]|nr:hypothetical protein [Klebsiella pneumoniae subsp. pneumoniae]
MLDPVAAADDGVPAAFVDYYFSGAQIKNADEAGRAAAQTISTYAKRPQPGRLGDCATSPQCSMTGQRRHWGYPEHLAAARDVRLAVRAGCGSAIPTPPAMCLTKHGSSCAASS